MSLSLIVAMDSHGLIGNANQLPWRLAEDLQRFKALTMGHPVLMGRKTWDSLGRPLPGRENIVLSRQLKIAPQGTSVYQDSEQALAVTSAQDGFVIGGKALFEMALPRVEKAYVTLLQGEFDGDAWFPPVKWDSDFTLEKDSGMLCSKMGLHYQYLDYRRL